MKWILKKFNELSVQEFHNILQLRINVFVVEQNCPYPELDGKDCKAMHFFAVADENPLQIIAYTRLFQPGDYYQNAAIGRVVVHPDFRHKNIGDELILKSIQQIEKHFKTTKIKIGAQTYLKNFYEKHGFKKVGEDYIEDGIPHIYMIRD
jgi:ElaA protein